MLQISVYRLLALAVILAAWTGGVALPAAEEAAKTAAPNQPPSAKGKQSAKETIRQALQKNVTLWYYNAPLKVVANDLEAKLGVPVRLDPAALKESGTDPAYPGMTFSIAKVSAKAAISHLLRPLGLTATAEHEAIWITSPQEAEARLTIKVYDVADLVASSPDASRDEQSDFTTLVDLITGCVQNRSWEENGGIGAVQGFKAAGIHALVVSQTQDAHDDLAGLLEQLRSIRHCPASLDKTRTQAGAKPREVPAQQPAATEDRFGPKLSAAERAIRLALEKPLTLHVEDVSLAEAVRRLAKAASTPILLDKKTPVEGDEASARVSLDAANRTLRAVLDELARSRKLAWTYHGEVLLLVPAEEDESWLVTRTYDLADLPAYRNKRGAGVPDYDHVKNTITETIDGKSWEENGGCGSIHEYEKAGIHGIVVSQTWKTHLQIEALLAKLRRLRGRELTADDIKKLPLRAQRPEDAAADPPPRPLEANRQREAVVAANNQFALDLHKKLAGENRIFSPSSLSTAMAMVYAGARGKTAAEMARTLHFDLRQEDVAPGFQSLLATLPGANHAGCTLTAANRLWGQQGYGFLEPFLATTRERFDAGLVEVNFANARPTCDLINDWADKQTAGKIKQIVQPGLISRQLRLIVTNAVYFKGLWAEPFNKEGTETAPFFAKGGQVDVPLMHRLTKCRYGFFDNVKVLEKPYRGGEISMVVLLPENEPNSLEDLEKSLSAKKLEEWMSDLQVETVDLFLPKFKLKAALPLNEPLASLGMAEVFDRKRADLSGINGGKEPLWLDWVLQKAYINVDEEGTEAAAVTAGAPGGFWGPELKIKVFRAAHPFLFLIRDRRTGCILFMGRLASPSGT